MRLVIRADGGPQIGGGHVMRCLTLAQEAARRGHEVKFIVGEGPMVERVRMAGHAVVPLPAEPHTAEAAPAHAHWLSAPRETDAALTAQVVAQMQADWLIWDHYGLDARWVQKQRDAKAGLRVLALDDLDDRFLGSDLVLDPARLGSSARVHPVPASLDGPDFALLRPEFAALRPAALARRDRGTPPQRVLIAPGFMDAAGLAPAALRALEGTGLEAEVVMGSASQSVSEVQALIAPHEDWTLTLDAPDMAQRMLDADLCIGAGGGTSWERCCMGLPSIVVAVAENQKAGIIALEAAGAAVTMTLRELHAGALTGKITTALKSVNELASRATHLCDGGGTKRVMDHVENSC